MYQEGGVTLGADKVEMGKDQQLGEYAAFEKIRNGKRNRSEGSVDDLGVSTNDKRQKEGRRWIRGQTDVRDRGLEFELWAICAGSSIGKSRS